MVYFKNIIKIRFTIVVARYPQNPEKNWGPKARAHGKGKKRPNTEVNIYIHKYVGTQNICTHSHI